MAMPSRKVDSVSCVASGVASSARPSWGSAGRYMSIDIGANAVRAPSRMTSPQGVAGGRAGMSEDWLKLGFLGPRTKQGKPASGVVAKSADDVHGVVQDAQNLDGLPVIPEHDEVARTAYAFRRA